VLGTRSKLKAVKEGKISKFFLELSMKVDSFTIALDNLVLEIHFSKFVPRPC
jgi:hypothetical protein